MLALGQSLVAVAVSALAVTTIAVALRFYTRIFIQHKFAYDDWLVLFCQMNFVGFCVCVFEEVRHGIGSHLLDILLHHPQNLVPGVRYWFIANTFYIGSTCVVKLVIAIFFYSLRPPKPLRIITIAMAALSIMAGIGSQSTILSCRPVSYFWTRLSYGAEGTCVDPNILFALTQTFNAIDIFTDVVLAILPCIMVWNMNMNRLKKFGISILLGLGGLSAVSPFIRAFYFRDLLFDTTDFTYSAWPVTVTSVTEPAIAITIVCITQLRPLMRKFFPKQWFSSASGRQQQQQHQPGCPEHRRATIGAGRAHPMRRSFGMSILKPTINEQSIISKSAGSRSQTNRSSSPAGGSSIHNLTQDVEQENYACTCHV